MLVVLLVVALVPAYLALKLKRAYWKWSLGVLAIAVLIACYTFYYVASCSGLLCGVGTGIYGLGYAAILAVVSGGIALIRKKNDRLLAAIILAPILLLGGAYGVAYYQENRTGSLNPYTAECKQHGFDGAKGDSCTCNDTRPSSACCNIPGTVCLNDEKSLSKSGS